MPASRVCNRYVLVPAATKLDFTASSTLHPIVGSVSAPSGYVDVACDDGIIALEPAPMMHVEFPVEQLRSGNVLQDREMYKRLDSKRNPRVVAELRDMRPAPGGAYRVSGDITLAGRTHRYEGELTIACASHQVVIDGHLPFDMRHFGITPPRLLVFSVAPIVDVRLHLVAASQEGS